jgi:signal transduction histidine kinase
MDKENGYILIGLLVLFYLFFCLHFLTVMLIYRKRKLEHAKEVEIMNEKFTQELLNAQLEVQQQTMQYIGREIHDNVGQKLTLAALYIQQLDAEK